jgi:glycosyltransferase involved in cell wall biosynthesis
MIEPHVTAVCLTADRQQFTDRAVAFFLGQTYQNKAMLILDNGVTPYELPFSPQGRIVVVRTNPPNKTIGLLRNIANDMCRTTDIVAHWDSDDYSHPLRLAWQVARLKGIEPGALDAVGYRNILFFRRRDYSAWLFRHAKPSYCVGTSLCYRRSAWEKAPFEEKNIGEDYLWLRHVKSQGEDGFFKEHPAMVAEIHGANTTELEHALEESESWKRVPEWDERLIQLMRLP